MFCDDSLNQDHEAIHHLALPLREDVNAIKFLENYGGLLDHIIFTILEGKSGLKIFLEGNSNDTDAHPISKMRLAFCR